MSSIFVMTNIECLQINNLIFWYLVNYVKKNAIPHLIKLVSFKWEIKKKHGYES